MDTESNTYYRLRDDLARGLWVYHHPELGPDQDRAAQLHTEAEGLRLRANFTRQSFAGLGGAVEAEAEKLAGRLEGRAELLAELGAALEDYTRHDAAERVADARRILAESEGVTS